MLVFDNSGLRFTIDSKALHRAAASSQAAPPGLDAEKSFQMWNWQTESIAIWMLQREKKASGLKETDASTVALDSIKHHKTPPVSCISSFTQVEQGVQVSQSIFILKSKRLYVRKALCSSCCVRLFSAIQDKRMSRIKAVISLLDNGM